MTTAAQQRATARLYRGLRLVLIDIETAHGPDSHRVTSFAAVTCRNDDIGGKWEEFVNPGIPIYIGTMRIHKMTDDRIAQ